MKLPDYSARDATIRHQTYTPIRRREGVPQDLFDAYWRDVHGPLCARLPGLGYYAQHHLDRSRDANLWPLPEGVELIDTVLDGMVEIGFANPENQKTFEAASPLLFKDEKNFIGHDVAYSLPNGSRTLLDHDPDPVPNGEARGHHLHLHLRGSGPAFEHAVTELAESLTRADGIKKVRLHLPEPYHNSEPAPEAPKVDHELPESRKKVALLEVAWFSRLAAERYLASSDYAPHRKGLAQHAGAMAAFRVAAIYTYIRDGELTLAGLRGSRQAELIEQLGALNQTQPEVLRLFAPPSP